MVTARRNLAAAALLFGAAAGMAGLAYASVPLYRLFCQVTGFGGTTRVAAGAPGAVAGRVVTVRFDANVARDLPWRFEPAVPAVKVAVGENVLAFYRARNVSNAPITGTATFNVTPHKAGSFFAKVECFCFTEQTLAPGETVELPVSFFIDPAILKDPEAEDVGEITLSYTFFRALAASRG
ncbi:MAG: cytochrome c oxidase assembly protein [Rhodospirillales bacterium]|nr:cytochrome c oxidase assembly protein [Rhodospirillales bacterium]